MQLASAAVLTALLAAAAPAHAEPDAPKSETTALALSLGGSIASVGLMAYGLERGDYAGARMFQLGLVSSAITPSLGHVYAGEVLSTGLGLRTAGAAVALIGVAHGAHCIFDDCGFAEGGGVELAIGGGLAAVGAVWDIATAPKAARRYNTKHISLVPASPGANFGLSIAGQF